MASEWNKEARVNVDEIQTKDTSTNLPTAQSPIPTAPTSLSAPGPILVSSTTSNNDSPQVPRVITLEIPASHAPTQASVNDVKLHALSAISNKDDPKGPRVVTFEIPASPVSHVPTQVPANDVELFALEA